jgi:hypothetical protein
MAGLTESDLRRIERFVRTPPRKRTPHLLTPDEEDPASPDPAGDGDDDGAA